jgi:hypothetical protein
MRSIILLALASVNITLLAACTTINPSQSERYRMANCTQQEGYPDCKEGHLITSASAANLTPGA